MDCIGCGKELHKAGNTHDAKLCKDIEHHICCSHGTPIQADSTSIKLGWVCLACCKAHRDHWIKDGIILNFAHWVRKVQREKKREK